MTPPLSLREAARAILEWDGGCVKAPRRDWCTAHQINEWPCPFAALRTALAAADEREDVVTRLEVIDEHGRTLVRHGVRVELLRQDDGRTLKVFVRAALQEEGNQ